MITGLSTFFEQPFDVVHSSCHLSVLMVVVLAALPFARQ